MRTICIRHVVVRIVLIAAFTLSPSRFGPSPDAREYAAASTLLTVSVAFENRVFDSRHVERAAVKEASAHQTERPAVPVTPEKPKAASPKLMRVASQGQSVETVPPTTEGPEGKKSSSVRTEGFVLSGITFHGVTAFSLSSLAKDYDSYLATRISVQDMAAIAQAVTKKYRDAGYFLTRAIVPEQKTRTGVLTIEVFEGYVADVKFENGGSAALKRYFEPVLKERPARLSTIDRAITLARDLYGVTLQSPQIQPIPDDPRAYHLVIPVKRKRVSATASIDNRGTKAVGKLQTYLTVSATSLLSTGDQLTAGFFTVPNQPKELLFGNASYTAFLNRLGTNITLRGGHFKSVPGASLKPFDVRFDSDFAGIRLSQPIIRSHNLGLWANLDLEGRDIHETQARSLIFSDKIRELRGSIDFYHRGSHAESRFSIEVTQGLPVLGASDTSIGALVSRPGANRDFTKATFFASRYQDLGKVFGFYLAGTGQYAGSPMLTSENFALGGPKFGRAYDYWEVSGESGIAGTAELRYGRDPGIKWLSFYQLYAFYDVGAVWNKNMGTGSQRSSLSSAGAGVRVTLFKKIALNYEVAVPLARVPIARTSRAPRHFFSVSAQF